MPVGNPNENKRTRTDRPRLRYAPSPTGDPHVGNIRQAVWSWLHAKRYGGDFIVRLEDTDQSRAQAGADKRILDSLRWLGVEWDEGPDIGGEYGPYIQSQRLDLYHDHIATLLKNNAARRCFCSPERLTEIREEQQANKLPPGIRDCCDISPQDADARAAAGEPHVVRFKTPREGTTVATDLLRGDISFENSTLDDFVLLKSDGFPTYHLAHVVDDHAMDITLVTRGEEWISSLPRHALLFDAFGYDRPEYAHASVIRAPGGGKLSKRDGAKSANHGGMAVEVGTNGASQPHPSSCACTLWALGPLDQFLIDGLTGQRPVLLDGVQIFSDPQPAEPQECGLNDCSRFVSGCDLAGFLNFRHHHIQRYGDGSREALASGRIGKQGVVLQRIHVYTSQKGCRL